ncbi:MULTISPECIES: head decoration protein [Klebsiella]|uniref:head decoration protein n=1 Tax=Klebsiella TaxID=570 RepID=UPI0009B663AB|nr:MULTISPECIES: head decoration protein [Klebsiella]ARB24677.1 head decoration protein [Klebsiella oxytoca]ELI8806988.1 head decoration protein [Klebsiella michiganensis]MBA1575941.1 head decoration protein [Klebsiella pneumoniae]MBE0157937.1 head decoration protein [Klebsiella michiganensis]MBE0168904.1 head decoration protein [Klebsiella michiganensis]
MDQFGQNQFAPGMKSSLFLPDQLIAGTLQLVTDSGIITGGTYKRGTVLGMVTASGKYKLSVKTATDGSETPVAILVDNVNASTADQNGGLYLMGEFNQNYIIFDDSWTIPALKTALRPLAIFLKDSTQAPVTTS